MESNFREPVIHTMLDVSTAHLTASTLKWLWDETVSEDPNGFIVYAKSEYGYFIPIIDESLSEGNNIPDDLMQIIDFAQNQDCTWLMIERDGFTIDQLPLYD